jgi:hypothetical protein
MIQDFNDKTEKVLSFSRAKNGNQIITIINYSDESNKIKLNSKYQKDTYKKPLLNADFF